MSSGPAHHIVPLNEIQDAFQYNRKVHFDERGLFTELLRKSDFPALDFKQENVSFSYAGVLRGMHTQRQNPQGKLITCVYGTILDVVFDIRKDSPTFGKGLAKILEGSDEMNSLYAPPGCLHGFLALSRFSVVHYSCTEYYEPQHDSGVRWDSPEIREFFPEGIYPELSAKDRQLPLLDEYLSTME